MNDEWSTCGAEIVLEAVAAVLLLMEAGLYVPASPPPLADVVRILQAEDVGARCELPFVRCTVGADDAEALVPNAGSELPSVRFAHGRGEHRGGGNVDALLGQFDREDMLREVSKLPMNQRAKALEELEKRRALRAEH